MNLGFILYPLCHSCGIPFVLVRFLLAIIIASEGLYEHQSYSLHSSFVRKLLLPVLLTWVCWKSVEPE
jgi:Trk-type K+ transport system membrane component